MPEKLERCVKHLIAQGKSKDSAWAMCTASVMHKGKEKEKK